MCKIKLAVHTKPISYKILGCLVYPRILAKPDYEKCTFQPNANFGNLDLILNSF